MGRGGRGDDEHGSYQVRGGLGSWVISIAYFHCSVIKSDADSCSMYAYSKVYNVCPNVYNSSDSCCSVRCYPLIVRVNHFRIRGKRA